jgi:isoleucyl-tRNA synthetase
VDQWLEIDRYALVLMERFQNDVLCKHYDKYEFHHVSQKLQTFCSEDLGGFYLDILKDRLYTAGTNSRARRSAQNALYHLTQGLVRLLAPILSFTAEETWALVRPDASDSVFLHVWHAYPEMPEGEKDGLMARWSRLRDYRSLVTKELETVRVSGAIGSSLAAEVEVHVAPGALYDDLAILGDDLRFVLITSKASLVAAGGAAEERIVVMPSKNEKCERCWHYREDVGSDTAHPGLCGRCVSNLFGPGEQREHA